MSANKGINKPINTGMRIQGGENTQFSILISLYNQRDLTYQNERRFYYYEDSAFTRSSDSKAD